MSAPPPAKVSTTVRSLSSDSSHSPTLLYRLDDHDEERDEFLEKLSTGSALKSLAKAESRTTRPKRATSVSSARSVAMTPLSRKASEPPAVGSFGGVAPTGLDAEEGLRAVRSHAEEVERELRRQTQGPDPWSVKFEPGDSANPKNWGVVYRWFITGVAGVLVLSSTWASSAPSGVITDLVAEFGLSQAVAVLTISLFVAGYCVGPLLWGPLSEAYGRRPIFIITFIDHRGQAMSLYSLMPFAGPSIGPIVSGFISVSGTSWRWVFWILTIFAGLCFVATLLWIPETYAPKILQQKAVRLRKETGEQRWYAPLERQDTSFKARLEGILLKPFIMLAREPMLMALTTYMSFVYGVVYLLFEAFPFVFQQVHGFNAGENGLAFLAFSLGGFIAVIIFMTVIEPRYQRHVAAVTPMSPKPEMRLELSVIAAWCMTIAMFWFGWTSYNSIHWISPMFAAVLLGFGVLGMFVSCFNYIVDVYLWAAASALAATTVVRSMFGAGFPLFAGQMFERLGTQWASSLLGFLALALAPIPIFLMIYGPKLRQRSRYSPNKQSLY